MNERSVPISGIAINSGVDGPTNAHDTLPLAAALRANDEELEQLVQVIARGSPACQRLLSSLVEPSTQKHLRHPGAPVPCLSPNLALTRIRMQKVLLRQKGDIKRLWNIPLSKRESAGF